MSEAPNGSEPYLFETEWLLDGFDIAIVSKY